MNYMTAIEKYQAHKNAIHELMSAIYTGVFDKNLFNDEFLLKHSFKWISKHYPFVELMFTLDNCGIQTSKNISNNISYSKSVNDGFGVDRSNRPYFIKTNNHEGIVITEPYLSGLSYNLCISMSQKYINKSGEVVGVLVIDMDLASAMEFLTGDRKQKKHHFLSKRILYFIMMGLGLLTVFYFFNWQ